MSTEKIRKDFPILERKINGKPLVYLDNSATSQKPKQVIEAMLNYYEKHNANVHRGIHTLSDEATHLYEDARKTVAEFIGGKPEELVFTKGTTDSLNAVALMLQRDIKKGDEIITTVVEHHSNFIPWQRIAEEKGAVLKVISMKESQREGSPDFPMRQLKNLLSKKTKIVALGHVSNVLGTVFPVTGISREVHKYNKDIKIVVDGAQSVPHIPVNVKKLGIDFLTFSGHKMLGPMGIGGLWIREELAEKLTPFSYGGGMINKVSIEKSTWAATPHKFEAGTPNVAGAVGLAEAVKYLEKIGMKEVKKHTQDLAAHAIKELRVLEDVRILGPLDAEKRAGLVSFVIEGVHAHDIAGVLDAKGIAIRAGQHCTAPLHKALCLNASARVSFQIYNTKKEIDYFIESLREGLKLLR
ncbi:SufS family cysteine desulfurase [candidate division WWE3 bacterium]|nr:SufS family cysteine desulfurase [candidate division WWE3 bacterium]